MDPEVNSLPNWGNATMKIYFPNLWKNARYQNSLNLSSEMPAIITRNLPINI